jgi:hypothetical protein
LTLFISPSRIRSSDQTPADLLLDALVLVWSCWAVRRGQYFPPSSTLIRPTDSHICRYMYLRMSLSQSLPRRLLYARILYMLMEPPLIVSSHSHQRTVPPLQRYSSTDPHSHLSSLTSPRIPSGARYAAPETLGSPHLGHGTALPFQALRVEVRYLSTRVSNCGSGRHGMMSSLLICHHRTRQGTRVNDR